MAFRLVAPTIVCALCALCACAARHANDGCENPFPQIMARNAALPSTIPAADGRVLVIGSVADSATHHALSGAIVLFHSLGVGARDTTVAYTDSTGGFAVRLSGRGRYAYLTRSVAFSMARGVIDIAHEAETLRVELRHGPRICNIRMTSD